MKAVYLLLSVLAFHQTFSQKFTISGTIKDQNSGENLIGTSIYNLKTQQGTTANTYGFFSLTQAKDSAFLRISYVGYEPVLLKFYLSKDTILNVGLSSGTTLKEIVISGTSEDRIQETTRMSTIDVPIDQIKSMPALMGETDVLKVLQLLPGVQGGTEGSSGLYVRGGGPDQNLILLDGVPVYNASHLFGFFSVFNADAINHVELIKGGFPARYGGRLSSVIDISMKEGNNQELKGEGSIGLIASRVTIEGPLVKDRTSFIVSARRTYLDIVARPLIKAQTDGDEVVGYYFYDLNTKINHKVNEKNRLYLSAYMGDDRAYAKTKGYYINNNERRDYKDEFGLRWGNISTALRWNKIINNKLFSNVTATYSRYRFNIFEESEEKIQTTTSTTKHYYKNQYISGIRDYALKLDLDFIPNPSHYIKFGGQAINHLFTPGVYSYRGEQDTDTTFGAKRIYSQEFSAYVEDDFMISHKLKVNFGAHVSGFMVGKTFYHSLQPRVAARYLITPSLSWKGSFATMTQYIHLLTNAGLGLPTDLWVPSTDKITPEQSQIVSTGLAQNLNNTYDRYC
jgi:outer membrane receptor for ferrienterochelin and colicin